MTRNTQKNGKRCQEHVDALNVAFGLNIKMREVSKKSYGSRFWELSIGKDVLTPKNGVSSNVLGYMLEALEHALKLKAPTAPHSVPAVTHPPSGVRSMFTCFACSMKFTVLHATDHPGDWWVFTPAASSEEHVTCPRCLSRHIKQGA